MGASLQVELNKAQYYPGETVLIDINVHLPAINSAQITVEITELATVIYSETFDLDARNANGKLRTTWKIPGNVSFVGFGIDVRAFDGPLVLAETSSAFDVVLHWAQAPRYGFVASFEPTKTQDTIVHRICHAHGRSYVGLTTHHSSLLFRPRALHPAKG